MDTRHVSAATQNNDAYQLCTSNTHYGSGSESVSVSVFVSPCVRVLAFVCVRWCVCVCVRGCGCVGVCAAACLKQEKQGTWLP